MSATGRGGERRTDDFYVTPEHVIDAIVPHIPVHGMVLDAGCGAGAIGGRLADRWGVPRGRILGVELDEGRARACSDRHGFAVTTGDFLAEPPREGVGLVIANPPFSSALEFVQRGLEHARIERGTVAMLLRLGFLASAKRAAFLAANPPDFFVFSSRPSFTGQGTDSTEYAWFVWGPGRGRRWALLDATAAKKARKPKAALVCAENSAPRTEQE